MRAIVKSWLAVAVLFPVLAMGQPLADRVPDDAIVYIGWAGTNALQHPYDGTHLQGIMEHSDIPQLLDRALPGLIERVAQEDPDTAETVKAMGAVLQTTWQHPTALYIQADLPPTGRAHGANETTARTDIARIAVAINVFELDLGGYPTTDAGLGALVAKPADLAHWHGPYLAEMPTDPWGNAYQYRFPGKRNPQGFDVWSFGPDGRDGSDDDIGNWNDPAAGHGAAPGDPFRVTILVDAGEQAEPLTQQLTQVVAGTRTEVQNLNNLVILSFQPRQVDNVEATLHTSDRFTAAISQLQDQPALCVYIDARSIHDAVVATIEAQVAPAGPAELTPITFAPLAIPLHLFQGIDTIAWSAGFDGKMWRTQTFISAPAPRSGLAALLDAEPVSDEILRAIPQNAEWVTIRRLDLAKLHDEVRAAFEARAPDGGAFFDQGMGAATMTLGANPKTTLFDPLGDEWAIYTAPQVGGDSVLGGVVLNRVDDPARIQRGLSSIAIAATNIASGQTPPQMRFQVGYAQHNGTRISYINTPFITPAWAVKDTLLVMGLYPQTVAAALDATGSDGSILDNETFQKLRQNLGDQQATSLSFIDLAKTAEKTYPSLLMWGQLYGGGADLFIDDVPPMLIPTMENLRPHLTPSGRVAWVDDQGWRARTIAPFPMAGLLAGEVSQIAQQYPMAASVIVPSLMRAREQANHVSSMKNMRQLLVGVHMYANDNDGRVPQRLSDLASYTGNHNALDVFVRPGHQRVPADSRSWTDEQVAEWIDNNSSYIYLRAADRFGEIQRPGEVIIMHESIEGRKPTDFVAVGFADGHVESIMVMRLEQRLAEQRPQ